MSRPRSRRSLIARVSRSGLSRSAVSSIVRAGLVTRRPSTFLTSRLSSVVEWCTISPDGLPSPAVTISSCLGQERQTFQSTSAHAPASADRSPPASRAACAALTGLL